MRIKRLIKQLDPDNFQCTGCFAYIPIVDKFPYKCPRCTRVYHRIVPYQVWEKGYCRTDHGIPRYSTELIHNAKYTLQVKK